MAVPSMSIYGASWCGVLAQQLDACRSTGQFCDVVIHSKEGKLALDLPALRTPMFNMKMYMNRQCLQKVGRFKEWM